MNDMLTDTMSDDAVVARLRSALDEVAALATFLLGDEAGWITGGLHSIDGGRALTSLR